MTFQIIMSTFCFQENNINISAWIILMNYFQQLPAEYKKKWYLVKICLSEPYGSLVTSLCLVDISEMT